MKTFDKEFPDAVDAEQFEVDGDAVVYRKRYIGECNVCERLTNFYSLCFEGWFCSRKCLNGLWKDYFNTIRKKNDVSNYS